jgi:hypothetical protein
LAKAFFIFGFIPTVVAGAFLEDLADAGLN